MKVCFLLDEHLPKALVKAVQAYDSATGILRVGLSGAPPFGTVDPDLLAFCEAEHRVMVTDDRRTMPTHAANHRAAEQHYWGLFIIDRGLGIGDIAFQLAMFWGASEAEEWIDRQEYLPY